MDSFKPLPIPQMFESVHRNNQISIPRYGYFRNISSTAFSCLSSFYDAFRTNHGRGFSAYCTHCDSEHSSMLLSLPDNFSPFILDFVIDFLEGTPQSVLPPSLLFPVLRLCGYLLVENHLIFALIQFYVPSSLRRPCSFTRALVEELNRSGYHQLGSNFTTTYLSS